MNNLAGLMDRKVRIDYQSPGLNGEPNPIWTELTTVRAAKKDETVAREGSDGKTILATGRTTWTIRYRGDIKPTHRIVDLTTGIIYDIEGVGEIGRREATTLQTKRYNQ